MIKQILEANENIKPNTKALEVLKKNFPNCFKTDGSFDLKRFQEYISDKVNITKEGYELRFLGKNYSRYLASLDTTCVVKPDEEHNNKPENKDSENIYISGDNLDGLKILLKSYENKIKCIYIDPPYNTDSGDFVYNDKFTFTVEELAKKLSIDESEAKRILDLTSKGSASHSAWLMFMYPRLLLARDLLTEDGVIFISIDDNEQANLKLLCDDVFGEENFICDILREAIKGGSLSKNIRSVHDYIFCYCKNINEVKFGGIEKESIKLNYEDEHGKYAKGRELNKWGAGSRREDSPSMFYPIIGPNGEEVYPIRNDGSEGRWRLGKKKMNELLSNDNAIFEARGDGTYIVYEKLRGNKTNIKQFTTWFSQNYINSKGTEELKNLFACEKAIFDFPKPTNLIKDLIIMCAGNGTILDFFSGSGTTAHAVMQQNIEDGGNRKFIMVQIPEQCKKDSEAKKAGYNNICEIGIERIKRASKRIKEEKPLSKADLGFKHFILEEPNQNTLDKLESFDPQIVIETNNILEEFGIDTILTTWLNHDGYGLTSKAEAIDFNGYIGYYIKDHLYLINKYITTEAIKAIVEKLENDLSFTPNNIVVFGYSFNWKMLEELKINTSNLRNTEKKITFDVRY